MVEIIPLPPLESLWWMKTPPVLRENMVEEFPRVMGDVGGRNPLL